MTLAFTDLMTPRDREDKLPKWAQEYIQRLRIGLDDEHRRADDARYATKPDESDALIDYYADIPIGLGRTPHIRFRIDQEDGPKRRGDSIDICLTADRKGVEVRSDWGGVAVRPQSGNVIQVRPVAW